MATCLLVVATTTVPLASTDLGTATDMTTLTPLEDGLGKVARYRSAKATTAGMNAVRSRLLGQLKPPAALCHGRHHG